MKTLTSVNLCELHRNSTSPLAQLINGSSIKLWLTIIPNSYRINTTKENHFGFCMRKWKLVAAPRRCKVQDVVVEAGLRKDLDTTRLVFHCLASLISSILSSCNQTLARSSLKWTLSEHGSHPGSLPSPPGAVQLVWLNGRKMLQAAITTEKAAAVNPNSAPTKFSVSALRNIFLMISSGVISKDSCLSGGSHTHNVSPGDPRSHPVWSVTNLTEEKWLQRKLKEKKQQLQTPK